MDGIRQGLFESKKKSKGTKMGQFQQKGGRRRSREIVFVARVLNLFAGGGIREGKGRKIAFLAQYRRKKGS